MSFLSNFTRLFTGTIERPSPSDIMRAQGLIRVDTNIIIDLTHLNIPLRMAPRTWIPNIPDTNSMDGICDLGNNNLLIQGQDASDRKVIVDFIHVGDIAVYIDAYGNLIVHRVVKIGMDKQGKYFVFRGDNNASSDPGRVREKQIEWLSIGVIY